MAERLQVTAGCTSGTQPSCCSRTNTALGRLAVDAALLQGARAVDVRERTNALVNGYAATIVRVDTNEIWPRTDWPRDAFFAWFDRHLDSTDYRNEYELSRAAGISHSAISSWRKGRTRPGTPSLRKLAPKLKVTEAEILTRAGDPNAALVSGQHEPSAEERQAIAIIRASKLSKEMQDMLIERHLEERRQAEANLRKTIGMMENVQGS
jgi:transcriptional regulator with XRE-family HTH domain